MARLTEEQRLTKSRISLMRDPQFLAMSGILMVGKITVSDKPGTASTNGRDEVYSRPWIQTLTDKQLTFVVAHEAYHKMLHHRTVWKAIPKEHHDIANMAMDYVINGMLDHQAKQCNPPIIEMPKDKDGKNNGCLDHKYDGWDTMQVYKDLLKDAKSGSGQGSGFDEHDFDGLSDELEDLTEAEEIELHQAVDQALRQSAIAIGRMGGKLDRAVSDLLEPVVRWEDVLQDFITSTAAGTDYSTWRKVNRRWLGRDMYMPSMQTDSTKEIVFGIDTSGSIGGHEITRFLTECKAAIATANPEKVHIIYWDAAVASHEIYEFEAIGTFDQSTKPRGGGGTDVRELFNFIEANHIKPDCIVVLTDGYTPWPSHLNFPTLFGITTKGVYAPVGKSVHIKS